MQTTLTVGNSRKVTGSPVDISGGTSKATLANQVFTSSDPTIFTAIPDPAVPGGAIIVSVGAGTATFTESALATEPDGTTTETIQGVMTVIVTAVPPPPPPVAASIVFTVGDEFPSNPPAPTPRP